MIFSCEDCINRNNCPENKEQYERTCNTLRDVARGLDKLPEYHSYYSLEIKCDYWVKDKEIEVLCSDGEGDK